MCKLTVKSTLIAERGHGYLFIVSNTKANGRDTKGTKVVIKLGE